MNAVATLPGWAAGPGAALRWPRADRRPQTARPAPPPMHWPPWLARLLELRIDVDRDPARIDAELDALYQRLQRPGDRLHGIATVPTGRPGLVLRWREADGAVWVYVEDRLQRRLAGCTVFTRPAELGNRANPGLRAPHSSYRAAYQRQGLATAVYRWALDGGLCLVSGARQSAEAHALWQALARGYPLCYVDLRRRALRHLGAQVDPAQRDDLHTRLLLLGRGWTVQRLFGASAAAGQTAEAGA